jgi:Flp pilus assembly protein TadB
MPISEKIKLIMEEEKSLDYKQSLNLIEQMIASARNDHRERGDGWLIWGWLLFIASVLSIVCMLLEYYDPIEWIWGVLVFIGFSIAFLISARRKRNEVLTYVQSLLRKFKIGFFISLFTLIAASYITKSYYAFGYYYILYAFWMFIHGSAIRFTPLIVGACINWAAAILIFFTKDDFLSIMIISAVAILAGYLVPGYMLRSQYNRSSNPNRESL